MTHPLIPTLHTERFVLRAPKMADLQQFATFRAGPRSALVGGPFPAASAFTALCGIAGHWTLRGFGRFLVADRETDEALGIVGPFFPDDWPEPEIAWTVFDNAEGRGVAFEAAQAAIAELRKLPGPEQFSLRIVRSRQPDARAGLRQPHHRTGIRDMRGDSLPTLFQRRIGQKPLVTLDQTGGMQGMRQSHRTAIAPGSAW